ncbi:MAG: hypothetical protein V1802_01990 [Candidatus Aenigmatarchaeota archaeon]
MKYEVLGNFDNEGTVWELRIYMNHSKTFKACTRNERYDREDEFELRRKETDIGYKWSLYGLILPTSVQQKIESIVRNAETNISDTDSINTGKKTKCA